MKDCTDERFPSKCGRHGDRIPEFNIHSVIRKHSICPSTGTATSFCSGRSSLSHRMSTRSSSVLIALPKLTSNGRSFLELPTERRSSRWSSLRQSVLSIPKLFFVAPCSRHRCCLGCVSLHDAVPLICGIELLVIALFTLVALDLYVTDGKMFYTNVMEGQGSQLAIMYLIFLVISVITIAVTLFGWSRRRRKLYIVHIIWQWTVLEVLVFFAHKMYTHAFFTGTQEKNDFLVPSAVVFSVVSTLLIFTQLWWLFVFVDAMFFDKTDMRRSSNESPCLQIEQSKNRVSKMDVYDIESFDVDVSHRHSIVIPTVKLRRASDECSHSDCIDRVSTRSHPELTTPLNSLDPTA